MKAPSLFLVFGLLAGCSPPTGEAPTPDANDTLTPTDSTASPAASPPASTATATGVVEVVDPAAKTVTIAHGPVAQLQWPAMTMTFKAPDADLSSLKIRCSRVIRVHVDRNGRNNYIDHTPVKAQKSTSRRRIVAAGTITDEALLEERRSTRLAHG